MFSQLFTHEMNLIILFLEQFYVCWVCTYVCIVLFAFFFFCLLFSSPPLVSSTRLLSSTRFSLCVSSFSSERASVRTAVGWLRVRRYSTVLFDVPWSRTMRKISAEFLQLIHVCRSQTVKPVVWLWAKSNCKIHFSWTKAVKLKFLHDLFQRLWCQKIAICM